MSELRDIFPSKRAFSSGTHAYNAISVCDNSGHISFVTDNAVVTTQMHVDRCSSSLSIASCAPRDSKYVLQHAATVAITSSIEIHTRDAGVRSYNCAAWSPCGLRASGCSQLPLLAICGGVGLDTRVLKPPTLVQGTCPPWTVISTPSEALWNHHLPKWQLQDQEARPDVGEPKKRKSRAAADKDSASKAAENADMIDDTEKLAQAFLQRLGIKDLNCENEDDDYVKVDLKLASKAAERVRAVVPVAAAWSEIINMEDSRRVSLFAVASKQTIAVSLFLEGDDDDSDMIEDGAVFCVIDCDCDEDITCLAFSHQSESKNQSLNDVILAVGSSCGTIHLYKFSSSSAVLIDSLKSPPGVGSFVPAICFCDNVLYFVRGNSVVMHDLKKKTGELIAAIDSSGTSLSYSRVNKSLYVGTIGGTVKLLSCSGDSLTQIGELHCGGSVMGVTCSPTGSLLYCLTQPSLVAKKRACSSVCVFSTTSTATLADLYSVCGTISSSPIAIDCVPLVLSRCNQNELLSFVKSIDSSKDLRSLSFKYVVLSKAKALLFEEVDQLLIECAAELALAHSKSYLEEALVLIRDHQKVFSATEKISLKLHASFLLSHKSSDDAVKRIQSIIGSDPGLSEKCPICHTAFDDGIDDGTNIVCECENHHRFTRCMITRLAISPDMLLDGSSLRHCCCCNRCLFLPFNSHLFEWHKRWLCPFCNAVTV